MQKASIDCHFKWNRSQDYCNLMKKHDISQVLWFENHFFQMFSKCFQWTEKCRRMFHILSALVNLDTGETSPTRWTFWKTTEESFRRLLLLTSITRSNMLKPQNSSELLGFSHNLYVKIWAYILLNLNSCNGFLFTKGSILHWDSRVYKSTTWNQSFSNLSMKSGSSNCLSLIAPKTLNCSWPTRFSADGPKFWNSSPAWSVHYYVIQLQFKNDLFQVFDLPQTAGPSVLVDWL